MKIKFLALLMALACIPLVRAGSDSGPSGFPVGNETAEKSPSLTVDPTRYEVLREGQQGPDVTERTVVIANTDEEWAQLWSDVQGADGEEKIPQVDLEKHQIVALFAGEKSTGGHGITVEEVALEGNSIVIRARESAPSSTDMAIMLMSHPHLIVKVPAGHAVRVEWLDSDGDQD